MKFKRDTRQGHPALDACSSHRAAVSQRQPCEPYTMRNGEADDGVGFLLARQIRGVGWKFLSGCRIENAPVQTGSRADVIRLIPRAQPVLTPGSNRQILLEHIACFRLV